MKKNWAKAVEWNAYEEAYLLAGRCAKWCCVGDVQCWLRQLTRLTRLNERVYLRHTHTHAHTAAPSEWPTCHSSTRLIANAINRRRLLGLLIGWPLRQMQQQQQQQQSHVRHRSHHLVSAAAAAAGIMIRGLATRSVTVWEQLWWWEYRVYQ